jgi:hypothetical protein
MLFHTRRKIYHSAKLALWEVRKLIEVHDFKNRPNFDVARTALYDFQKVLSINSVEFNSRLFYESEQIATLITCFLKKSLIEYTETGEENNNWLDHWKVVEERIMDICDLLRIEYEAEELLRRRLASRR